MATHSSVLAWRIPRTEEPGGLQPMGSQESDTTYQLVIVVVLVQSLSRIRLFATPWTAARQASLSFTVSQNLLKLTSIESRCHPTILSSVVPFSSCLQSFPASGSFPVSRLFTSGAKVLEFQLQH